MILTNERRHEQRYEGIYAEYAVLDNSAENAPVHFKGGFLRNFSCGGASLFIHDKLPQSAFIWLRLYEPHSARPLEVLSSIAWLERSPESPLTRERFNVGMKFMNMEEDLRHRLELMALYFESEKNRAYNITNLIDSSRG